MARISVIVPVYNVEHYLRRCLDALCSQTFTDFEVILVDDSSRDDSFAICHEYAAADKRFLAVRKENGGAASARNRGMDIAKGDWLAFVDSDDYVDPRFLELLFTATEQNEVDMTVCGILNVTDAIATPQSEPFDPFVCSAREALGYTLEGRRIPGSMCNKLVRASCVTELRFPEGSFYEDARFTVDLTAILRKVWVCSEPLYHYCHRLDSSLTQAFNERHLDAITVYTYALKTVRDRYPDLEPQALFRLYWAYFTVLDSMLLTSSYRDLEDYPKVRDFLKKHTGAILRDAYFEKTRKIAACALRVNVGLYRLLLKAQRRRLWGDT